MIEKYENDQPLTFRYDLSDWISTATTFSVCFLLLHRQQPKNTDKPGKVSLRKVKRCL